jgi:hypothetical protein
MTQKEIDRAKEDAEYGTVLYEELSCRDMINSMLIYGDSTEVDGYNFNRYLKPYYVGRPQFKKKPLLTRERVIELIEEQKESFKKAKVSFAGYDSEGVSYNSCDWGD